MRTVGYHIVDVSIKKSVDLNSGTNPCYEGEEDYEVAEYRALGEQLRSAGNNNNNLRIKCRKWL